MELTTSPKSTLISVEVVDHQSVQSTNTVNVVQIDRKPAFQDVSKVYGPPGLPGHKGDPGAPGAPGKDGAPGIGAYTASFPVQIDQAVIKLDQSFLNQNIYLTDGGSY